MTYKLVLSDMNILFIILFAGSPILPQLAAGQVNQCSEEQWRCRNGKCIDASWKCNGAVDCADGSDETFPLCRNTQCKKGFFQCTYGACVNSTATCNGVKDCTDNSDELLLSCRNETDYYGCLTKEMKERARYFRTGIISALSRTGLYRNITESCVMKDRTCKNGEVVSFPNRCDGKVDCKDGSDETVEACASNWCTMSTKRSDKFFRCAYGACVPKNAYCNGVLDCADGSDENVELCNTKDSSGACILPVFPKYGFYIVIGYSSFYPGQAFNVVHLTFSCRPGYRLVGPASCSCVNGWWSENRMPQCVDCGRIAPGNKLLIIGGLMAKRDEIPWHAAIYTKTTRPYKQICGGTLVSNTFIISAAHCFWSDVKKKLPASDYAAAIGKLHRPWNSTKDIDPQKSDVRDIKIPPRYQGGSMNYQDDIALLVLITPIEYRAYVRPVCLDFDHNFNENLMQDGKSGKVAGWGLTEENGIPSQELKLVDLPYVSVENCISHSPIDFRRFITSDKICAGYRNGSAAVCRGDSGGGLTFPVTENGIVRHFLRGIVSTAPNNGNLCNAFTVTSFTDVIKHESFIKEHPETPVPIQLISKHLERCSEDQWRCRDGKCIVQSAICNGTVDCADSSDETFPLCRNTNCSENSFQCTYGACVNSTATCNGVMDCADNSDELIARCRNETGYLGCLDKLIKENYCFLDSPLVFECEKRDRFCKDGEEVGLLKRCNGKVDCKDGSDESLETCASHWCPVKDAFRCAYGGCVPGVAMCDGIIDCADGSDESDELCKANIMSSGECILPPFPTDGTYTVVGQSNIYPGKVYDVFYLNFSCNAGYRLVGPASPYCLNGWWSELRMPQCVLVCKLKKHPSVKYSCLASGSNNFADSFECGDEVLTSSIVMPKCSSNYYFDTTLPLMRCINGAWNYVAKCTSGCGKIASGVIQNNEERGKIPWHAGLYIKGETTFQLVCGGSIVTSKFVLTAAQCVLNEEQQKLLEASNIAVVVGKLYRSWNSTLDTDTQTSNVSVIFISPGYRGVEANFQDDIAIIEVTTPLQFSAYVRAVCVGFDMDIENTQLIDGKLGKIAGWGPTEDGNDEMLKVQELTYIGIERCIEESPPQFRQYITSDKICAGNSSDKAACVGDNGSGLAFLDVGGTSEKYYLRGILSYIARITPCSADTYGAFTQISKHKHFIVKTIPSLRPLSLRPSPSVMVSILG